jgi:hypothetical protein
MMGDLCGFIGKAPRLSGHIRYQHEDGYVLKKAADIANGLDIISGS